MTNGEQVTGAPDEHYNVVRVLYHTMQEAAILQTYIEVARSAGDDDLAGSLQGRDPTRAGWILKMPTIQILVRVIQTFSTELSGPLAQGKRFVFLCFSVTTTGRQEAVTAKPEPAARRYANRDS
jgi:hypothetical protein